SGGTHHFYHAAPPSAVPATVWADGRKLSRAWAIVVALARVAWDCVYSSAPRWPPSWWSAVRLASAPPEAPERRTLPASAAPSSSSLLRSKSSAQCPPGSPSRRAWHYQ